MQDSLFAIGQFSNATEGNTIGSVIEVLTGLLEERTCLLLQQGMEVQPSFALLEDLHWLLLFIGHVLVSGPSMIDSSRTIQSSWDTNFSVSSSH